MQMHFAWVISAAFAVPSQPMSAVPGSEGAAPAVPCWVEGKILDLGSAQKRGMAAFKPHQKTT